MVMLVALKNHPIVGVGRKVRVGETFEVPDRLMRVERHLKLADLAPEGAPEPVYRHGYKRRDIPAAPARANLQPERKAARRVMGAAGSGSGLTPPTNLAPPKRGRGRPRKVRPAEEPGDEGETE